METKILKNIFNDSSKQPLKENYCLFVHYLQLKPISYKIIHKFINDLYFQLYFLKINYNLYISHIDIQDIIVINDSFYFNNTSKIYVCENDYITIDHYSKKDLGLTPEMKTNNLIPFITPYTSCYYSIGMFILSLLCKMENIENITHNMNFCELLQYLKKYENIKLYHTLLYCLHEDPCERKFIVF